MVQSTFSLQVKQGSKPYQVPPRHIAYVLQEPFKMDLDNLQEEQIVISLGVSETAELCNSFNDSSQTKWHCLPMPGPH